MPLRELVIPVPSLRHKAVRRARRLRKRYAPIPKRLGRRFLFVLHDAPGGVAETTADLARQFAVGVQVFSLEADPYGMTLRLFEPGEGWVDLRRIELAGFWSPFPQLSPRYRAAYDSVLALLEPDVVHVRHLLGHTHDLGHALEANRAPWVFSAHDYFLVCPTIHLLDDRGQYCGGVCTEGDGQCRPPLSWLGELDGLKHGRVRAWQENAREFLGSAKRVVVTSESVKDLFAARFPTIEDRIVILEHGRQPLPGRQQAVGHLRKGKSLRVLVLGAINRHKGAGWLSRIMSEIDSNGWPIEIYSLGADGESLRELTRFSCLKYSGRYSRDELRARAAGINAHLLLLPSIWPETYSHVLTEGWQLGLPAIVGDLGAPAERVRRHGGGWVVPPGDADAVTGLLMRLIRTPAEHAEAIESVKDLAAHARNEVEMGKLYLDLYDEVVEEARLS